MSDFQESQTNVSLLLRVKENADDVKSWREFVDRYGKRIFQWCLNRRLQAADAEDVTQNVLLKLAKNMSKFEYQEKLTFRGWLRRITENSVNDFFRECRARRMNKATADSYASLVDIEAPAELSERLCEEFDLELLEIAKRNIQTRVSKKRWEAWMLLAVENCDGSEVAERLGMKMPSVYSSRYQVQMMITAEVKALESSSENLLLKSFKLSD